MRWHGGKWRLAPWIIAHFPAHRTYVEPFGGAASVLLRKQRAYAEVYNDLDTQVVNLFRVLRDPAQAPALVRAIALTPFARAEFELAFTPTDDPVESARRLVVRSFMGFGSNAHALIGAGASSTGFRSNTTRSGTTPAADWRSYPAVLPALIERLSGVVIENREALAVMARHDGPETLHYVDPPYLPELRGISRAGGGMRGLYRHEMSRDDHTVMLEELKRLQGMVVISGYPHALYDDALPGWRRIATAARADGARPRTEVLWLNPACYDSLDRSRAQGLLFQAIA
ncbi:DNA methyltransferase [Rhodoplanes roseus]|uniref:DNA methyltransferase n=1 Tax=Rhodoplanes roseus TaxID=29409 RepID=A0A327KP11_9BRAD|nr:DNA methyltransferase [Rhodoplanes roseus]